MKSVFILIALNFSFYDALQASEGRKRPPRHKPPVHCQVVKAVSLKDAGLPIQEILTEYEPITYERLESLENEYYAGVLAYLAQVVLWNQEHSSKKIEPNVEWPDYEPTLYRKERVGCTVFVPDKSCFRGINMDARHAQITQRNEEVERAFLAAEESFAQSTENR
jgi:hypothetical protein